MLNEYLQCLKARRMSDSSIITRTNQLQRFLCWLEKKFASSDLKGITSSNISEYCKYLQAEGLKPNSVNSALSALNSFCKWMTSHQYLTHNPVEDVKRIEIVKSVPRVLDENEQHSLMQTILEMNNNRDSLIVLTLLFTGIRVAELVELVPNNIILKGSVGILQVRVDKNNNYRQILIDNNLIKRLNDYISENASNNYLFEGQRFPKLTARAVLLICRKIGKSAKIDDLTPTILRRTMVYYFANMRSLNKVDMRVIHSHITKTVYYANLKILGLQQE
jgi:integrase/recombinase XerD